MDTTDPTIEFNKKGECNRCTEFLEKRIHHSYNGAESDAKFLSLISEIKAAGKGERYDCVLGLSGGIDSSYVAYLAKQNGLRVLTVHLDNGWNAEEAVLNIRNIAKILDIDYESFVLDWEEFKDLQLSFLKASVPEAETPTDIAIPGALHKVAAKYNVKYILSGGNFATEGILPPYWHYNAKDMVYLKSIHKKFGSVKLKSFPVFGFRQEAYYKLVKGIKIVYPLNFVNYDKEEAMNLLKSELNWRYYGGKHYESRYTGFIQSYYLYKKFSIDYRRATFASQICKGTLDKDKALQELEKLPFDQEKVDQEKQYIAKKLGISIDEFNGIIDSPPKWYTSYPNDEKRLGKIYNIYRKLFKKEKLASY